MTKKQILDGNKLISEFMELKGFDDGRYGWMWNNPTTKKGSCFSLEYNSSWDWLIPVVEKIEQLGYHTRICFDDFGSWMQIHYGLSVADTDETKALNQHGTKIENTFKSVVEFIKWYNKNGKPSRKK